MENQLHREILEEHAQSYRLKGFLNNADYSATYTSSQTGNECQLSYNIENNSIDEIFYSIQGSALSNACASIMCSEIKGLNLLEVHNLAEKIVNFVEKSEKFELTGDLVVYETITRFPERHDCSLLSWKTLLKTF